MPRPSTPCAPCSPRKLASAATTTSAFAAGELRLPLPPRLKAVAVGVGVGSVGGGSGAGDACTAPRGAPAAPPAEEEEFPLRSSKAIVFHVMRSLAAGDARHLATACAVSRTWRDVGHSQGLWRVALQGLRADGEAICPGGQEAQHELDRCMGHTPGAHAPAPPPHTHTAAGPVRAPQQAPQPKAQQPMLFVL